MIPITARITSQPQTDTVASGSISTQNLVPAGVATANSAVEISTIDGLGSIAIQVTGTYTGALTLQGRVDSGTWVSIGGVVFYNVNTGASSTTIASAATGIFQAECSGYTAVRITALAAVTGTAVITIRAARGTGIVAIDSPIPAGTNAIGTVTLAAGTNVAGKVGIDQTTDGTTNKVAAVGLPSTAAANACSTGLASSFTVLNIKNSAGSVYGISVVNPNASTIYVQFYNTSGTPTLGTSVVWWLAVPASSTLNIPPHNIALANFATGIGIGASTTPTSTGTPGTAPSATIFYK